MMRKLLIALAATLPLMSACAEPGDERRFSAEDEALYLARFEAQQAARSQGGGLNAYDPLEEVPGAQLVQPFPAAATPTIAAETLTQAKDYAAKRNTSALIVWKNGAIEEEVYFEGYDREALVKSKALSKPMSAIAVGRAIALGYIQSLDQPAADFISEWQGDPQRSKITLRHLLGMRSGLLPQAFGVTDPDSVLNRAYLHPRHDEVIIHEYPITDAPGSRYEYSNVNAEIIAPIIERASGQRYGTFISDALLKPLGAAGGSVWINRPGGTAHAGCCMLLPAQSFLRLAVLLVQDGVWKDERLLPAGYVAEMQKTDALNPHAGLGVWVAGDYVEWRGPLHPSIELGRTYHSAPYAYDDLFLFDGNGNQTIYIIPSQQMVILRTGTFPPKGLEWDNSYLPNLIAAAQ